VLFISYPFPPVGGAGVQRVTKFVKYLHHHGWLPSVLTVANPSVPALDESLLRDIPDHVTVRRARTWEPSYALKAAVSAGSAQPQRQPGAARRLVAGLVRRLSHWFLQPDVQVLWLPGAVREGRRLLREVPHAAIVASGPPFSTFLIGAALSRGSGLPLILDYRDEWDLSSTYWENQRHSPLVRRLQSRLQRRAVRSARALIATTQASAQTLERIRAAAASTARVTWIYNGFDPEDFPAEAAAPREGREFYRLAYVGTLWDLTSVAPLVTAVQALARLEPELAARLELVFAGRRTSSQEQALQRLRGLPCRVVVYPYLDHRGALDLIRSADGLCVLLSDLPGAERVVPAKLFEAMAARRAIVAIGPRGEMWDLLRDYPTGHLFVPADSDGIASCLGREIRRWRDGEPPHFPGWDASRYDRRHQARQLADLLQALT
jgi:glycosyltransferase involved in cell wall biosynthesis